MPASAGEFAGRLCRRLIMALSRCSWRTFTTFSILCPVMSETAGV
jgi:hypothetical protein